MGTKQKALFLFLVFSVFLSASAEAQIFSKTKPARIAPAAPARVAPAPAPAKERIVAPARTDYDRPYNTVTEAAPVGGGEVIGTIVNGSVYQVRKLREDGMMTVELTKMGDGTGKTSFRLPSDAAITIINNREIVAFSGGKIYAISHKESDDESADGAGGDFLYRVTDGNSGVTLNAGALRMGLTNDLGGTLDPGGPLQNQPEPN